MDLAQKQRARLIREWRKHYSDWSFERHQQFYSDFWDTGLPPQRHFCEDGITKFLPLANPRRVCEVGGWDGAMASLFGGRYVWVNYELCAEAAAACASLENYTTVTDRWVWDDDLSDFDTLVASHSIEHMSKEHLERLLGKTCHMTAAFVQVPINMGANDYSSHILGLQVHELVEVFKDFGWGDPTITDGPCHMDKDVVLTWV